MGAASLLIAAKTGIGLLGSYQQSKALKEKGKLDEQLSQQNARLMELQAEDTIIRGNIEAEKVKREGRFVKGSQRAGFAGQNIAVGTGTAAAIQSETDRFSGEDALTVKNNAFREAWGFKTEAINERFRGRMSRISSRTEAKQTLLTGGLNAANDIAQGFYMNSKFKDSGFKTKSGSAEVPQYLRKRATSANKLNLY